jgi:hypothetical protein
VRAANSRSCVAPGRGAEQNGYRALGPRTGSRTSRHPLSSAVALPAFLPAGPDERLGTLAPNVAAPRGSAPAGAPGFIEKGESGVAPSGLATAKRRFPGQLLQGPR